MTVAVRPTDAGRWMYAKPIATIRAVVVALLAGVVTAAIVIPGQWTALERYYLRSYVKSGIGAWIGARLTLRDQPYWQVRVTAKGAHFLATRDDVVQAEGPEGQPVFVLSPSARAAGLDGTYRGEVTLAHAEMHQLLATHVYRGGLLGYARTPLIVGGVTLLVLLAWSIPTDIRRGRRRRQGAHLRGAEMVSTTEFNRRVRSA